MKLDEINIAIIKHLRNGRISFRKIADALKITENTVRSRVKKLEDEGTLEFCGLVDPQSIPGHRVVIIGINIGNMNLVEKGEQISRLRGVTSVNVVTGRFDLLVTILFKEGYGLLEFYTDELSKIEDIRSVETFVVYKTYNGKVPYVL